MYRLGMGMKQKKFKDVAWLMLAVASTLIICLAIKVTWYIPIGG